MEKVEILLAGQIVLKHFDSWLELLFDTFCKSSNKYAWIGLDGKEVKFLNDFRYSSELTPWETFLVFLEAEAVQFLLPKIIISSDVPIFVTSKSKMKHSFVWSCWKRDDGYSMEGIWVFLSNTTISTKEFNTIPQMFLWFGFTGRNVRL